MVILTRHITLQHSWRVTSKHYENSSAHSFTKISHKQNTKNENDNITRKKYSLNNKKTTIWGFYCLTVEEPDVLGCYTVWMGKLFPTFRRNLSPSSSTLKNSSWPRRWMRYVLLKRRKAITRPYGATTQKTSYLDTKASLQMVKYFSVVSFPVRNAAAFPLDLAASFTVVAYSFSFWPARYTGNKNYSCYCDPLAYI